MADEIGDIVQIIRVTYDGVEIAMKAGSGGIDVMKNAITILKGMLDYEKLLGKTSMKKLLMKGGDLQVLQFKTDDMKKVKYMAKKYGILYSALPDINKHDSLSEFIFHTEAVPRANMLIQKLGFGNIATFDDYVKNGNNENMKKLTNFLKKQKIGGGKNLNIPQIDIDENKEKYSQLKERVKAVTASNNKDMEDITIDKSLIISENSNAIKTIIPKTFGKNIRYIWIEKENVMDINKGKTLLSFIDKNKIYNIYNEKNQVVEKMPGKDLYSKHYDKVEISVRKRYEEEIKQKNKDTKNRNIKNIKKPETKRKTTTGKR